ncbi:hypothetical protein OpiT1DRAFT_02822 [Opitutaceae bacterium TAV1]|nr:hypothetical protein OpiT1DRAFT_02822 [Opitutaceae bacterium TAV1]
MEQHSSLIMNNTRQGIPGAEFQKPPPVAATSFWEEIRHPFFWFSEDDLPRLRHNTGLPFWKPKFDAWREELHGVESLPLWHDRVDFHIGANTAALKAALCHVVDGDEHSGRLVGAFLSSVAEFYRRSPDWRVLMCANGPGKWTGNQWGGLTGNHIVDPQIWLSCAHLYDVIYGKNFMPDADAATFEEMMALCHQVSCMHEEMHKMDNNRSMWLCAGGYMSTLFDKNRRRADAARIRFRETMNRFLDTILEDGIHYEIGGYADGSLSVMMVFARLIRGAEGVDFFHKKIGGVGLEDACRAWAGTLIPSSSLRKFCYRDRVSHWDTIGAAYGEYHLPELGWALSRMHERPWVPMFRHWPQGFEFYAWRQPAPGHTQPPRFLHSHFKTAGMAFLRSSWEPDALSLYFRYGFQGSSHGGGLDKLNIEITCNDEPLIADPMLTEKSFDKNVVLVDGHCQEQCSGRLLYATLDEDAPVQCVSALGGFGEWPNREFLSDPRCEVNYWCVKNEECFPGRARMRRTVALVGKRFFVIRDTLWSLDEKEHDYEWLFHTFATPGGLGDFLRRAVLIYQPKRQSHAQSVAAVRRKADVFHLPAPRLSLTAEKASATIWWSALGAALPSEIARSESPAPYEFNGSPETGIGLSQKMLARLHLTLRGRDIVLTTVIVPSPPSPDDVKKFPPVLVEQIDERSLDQVEIALRIEGKPLRVTGDEQNGQWTTDGAL